jgi:hypothetical protein
MPSAADAREDWRARDGRSRSAPTTPTSRCWLPTLARPRQAAAVPARSAPLLESAPPAVISCTRSNVASFNCHLHPELA